MIKRLLTVFLIIGMTISTGCSVDNTLKENIKEINTETKIHNVGDTIKLGDLQYTTHNVKANTKGFFPPAKGMKYMYVDISVENIGDEEETVSSLLQFKLRNIEGEELDFAIGIDGKGSVDGSVNSGEKIRGDLVFEVPENLMNAELTIDRDCDNTGIVVIDVNLN